MRAYAHIAHEPYRILLMNAVYIFERATDHSDCYVASIPANARVA